MKSSTLQNRIFTKFQTAVLSACLLLLAGRVTAQTFTTLYSFTGSGDGANPYAGLILSGNTFYGTAVSGGSSGNGTVFKVNIDGTGFTPLYSFTGGSDGANPSAGLILSGNTLYGTASSGGNSGNGTVFKVNVDGTGFTTMHGFLGGSDGFYPSAGLILSGNTLYGTAAYGGSSGSGTVFKLNIDGTGFTTLYNFTQTSPGNPDYIRENGDGANPLAGLILSGNTLYGTAYTGGSWGNGTVFAVNTDGTGFNALHSFAAGVGVLGVFNSDGAHPYGGLVLSGNTLYGTTDTGDSFGGGTVFAVNTDGTGFTSLHSFTDLDPTTGFNSDGVRPDAGLILSGNTLFGTTAGGGSSGGGTVFAVNTDGTGFTNLHNFTGSDGTFSEAGLILWGNALYGTAFAGGSSGNGTIFKLTVGDINSLISLVQTFNLNQSVESSLDNKLQAAQAAMAAACGHLSDFVTEVQTKTGKKITTDQANQLTTAAAQIQAALGCP